MVVIVLEHASNRLRGELTRWLLETKPNVFVGSINARVREKVWKKISSDDYQPSGVMIYNSNTEQGFAMKMIGEPKRRVVDIDGIQLIEIMDE